jgi:hypothetical protein
MRKFSLALIAVLVAAVVLGRWRESDSAIPDNHMLTAYGIEFELPWQVYPTPDPKAAPLTTSTYFKLIRRDFRLEIVEGRLKLNGREYGPLTQGDRVRITEKGGVFVNSKERRPADGPPK